MNAAPPPDFQALFEALPGLYLVLDEQARVVAMSEAYARALDLRRENVVGKRLDEAFPHGPWGSGARDLEESVKRVVHSGQGEEMASRKVDVRRPPEEGGGFEERHWAAANSPVSAPDGGVARVIHHAQDVTGLAPAHEAAELREAAEQRRLLSEAIANLHDGVVITTAELQWPGPQIVFVNPAMSAITGYPREELLGQTPRRLQGPLTSRAELDRLRGELAEGRPFRAELTNYRKDGSPYVVELAVSPVRDTRGRVVNYVAVHHDVTARKQAEEALRLSEGRHRAVLRAAVDAIITIDRQGTILSSNPAAERMFGYAMDELLGQNVKLLMPEPSSQEHDQYLARYLRTGERRVIGTIREVEGRRKDGSTFPAELTVSEAEPRQVFTGIVRDATRRKQLEREVIEIASLEQKRIAHDLHDGVAQELTALSLVAGELPEALRPEAANGHKLAERLASGLQRCQQALRAVLRGLLPVAVDAEGLMAALADLAGRIHADGKAACTFECPEPVAVADNMTATHLYLIAHEAAYNAIKHALPRHVRISLYSDGQLVLRVRDDGIGMPEEAAGGLGLRIMRNRAEIIGATLDIESARPGGTVVTCTLPRREHERD